MAEKNFLHLVTYFELMLPGKLIELRSINLMWLPLQCSTNLFLIKYCVLINCFGCNKYNISTHAGYSLVGLLLRARIFFQNIKRACKLYRVSDTDRGIDGAIEE